MVHQDANRTLVPTPRRPYGLNTLRSGGCAKLALAVCLIFTSRILSGANGNLDHPAPKYSEEVHPVTELPLSPLLACFGAARRIRQTDTTTPTHEAPAPAPASHSIECLSCPQARALVKSVDHAAIIAITDRKGAIIYVNNNFEKISGYCADELIGKNHRVLNSGKHPKSFWKEMYQQLASGRVWRGEVCNRAKSGEEYWVDTAISAMRDEEGKIQQYVAIRFDITKRKQSELELRSAKCSLELALETASALNTDLEENQRLLLEAKAAAESAAQAKSDFLANMSHEIRTPMNAIVGFADILAESDKNEITDKEKTEYLRTISKQGKHLLNLINDILDLAKIESGALCTERIAFNPQSLLRDVSEAFAFRAHDKGIALHSIAESGVDEILVGDPTRVQQILTNLVGNAIKFTHDGCVEVRLRQQSGPNGRAIEYVVRDTGIGMSDETIARLFTAFEQADASTTRRYGGTGLGLCISEKLASLLGGQVLVESEQGVGSTFTLRLPIDARRLPEPRVDSTEAEAAPSRVVHRKHSGKPLLGVHVLLAEDSDDNAMLVEHHLKRAGASVTRVLNGLEAVEHLTGRSGDPLRDARVDIVIMDMQMPVMDGYTATSALRGCGCDLPIIAATAHAMQDDRDKCLGAGCTDYISKPINRTTLIRIVKSSVANRRTNAA